MTEVNKFVDRRSEEEKRNGLATQILFWYDKDREGKKGRIRTNGVAVTVAGDLLIARSTCSRKDQFVRAMGRLKVSNRIFGRAQKHCWAVFVDLAAADVPAAFAKAFSSLFPDDELGVKRAYNIGKVFARSRSN
jgi:hypothetical protein